ncbi:MAG: peptide chain release factor N(5)-glutamine methyltransferase [Schleiferilactobacillus harbinensis]|jgi:release factor glutamine methyltransferase|nr:peptide chain release factor N(5)-glutamine methyltransferase [Schleiferilactobacillus harbinensis]MCI1913164.1 peptide chain release factor N(5)-glutamine methyltransferase [Schleiferilactobacillus harbinensis]
MPESSKHSVTYAQWVDQIGTQLADAGLDDGGAEYVVLARNNWRHTDFVIHGRNLIPVPLRQQLASDAQRLLAAEPAQYVVGQAWFYGRPFQVGPGVLIPRPETEELVAWLLDSLPAQQPLRILDMGTGSGAIAVTVASERPDWQVTATDISPRALAVAEKNAAILAPHSIHFLSGDMFQPVSDKQYDVVISNPPYVAWSELGVMDQSVKKFEPSIALFAPHDGLAFYEQFIREVPAHLTAAGRIFLEYGYQQAPALKTMLAAPDWQADFRRDMAGHPRMVQAIWQTQKSSAMSKKEGNR